MPLKFSRLLIPDLVLIEPEVYSDERGSFMEIYKKSEFFNFGITVEFVQDNHSISKKDVLRGLHYQIPPKAQAKLVRCTRGRVFDVAVDLRKNSPTFAKWVGVELSDENHRLFYIPIGFAHGFIALSEIAEIQYKCTSEYSAQHERGIIWNDPVLNIDWQCKNPILSRRDSKLPFLRDAEIF